MKFSSKITFLVLAFCGFYSMADLSAIHLRVMEKSEAGELKPIVPSSYIAIDGDHIGLTDNKRTATEFTRKNVYEAKSGWLCELKYSEGYLSVGDDGWLMLSNFSGIGGHLLCWLFMYGRTLDGSPVDYFRQDFQGGSLVLMGEESEEGSL